MSHFLLETLCLSLFLEINEPPVTFLDSSAVSRVIHIAHTMSLRVRVAQFGGCSRVVSCALFHPKLLMSTSPSFHSRDHDALSPTLQLLGRHDPVHLLLLLASVAQGVRLGDAAASRQRFSVPSVAMARVGGHVSTQSALLKGAARDYQGLLLLVLDSRSKFFL